VVTRRQQRGWKERERGRSQGTKRNNSKHE